MAWKPPEFWNASFSHTAGPTNPTLSLEGVSLSLLITDPVLGSECNSEQGRTVALPELSGDNLGTELGGEVGGWSK